MSFVQKNGSSFNILVTSIDLTSEVKNFDVAQEEHKTTTDKTKHTFVIVIFFNFIIFLNVYPYPLTLYAINVSPCRTYKTPR